MLSRLAAERATGVLVRERGVLYLCDGEVVRAESPATPSLDVLLTARGVLAAESWREAVAEAGARRRVGRFLVERGRIAEGALELCHLGALYDAAYFVLGPGRGSRPGSGTGPRTGSAPCVPCPWPRWSVRRCAAASCCTGSGPTRRRTPPRWHAPGAPPNRRSPCASGSTRPGGTVCGRRRTSRSPWGGPRSTPSSTSAGWPRPGSSRRRTRRRAPLPKVLAHLADPDVALLRRLRDALEAL